MDYKIILNETSLNNLKLFLERTNMSGKEVLAYLNIVEALNLATPIESHTTKEE